MFGQRPTQVAHSFTSCFDGVELRTLDVDASDPFKTYLSLRRAFPGDSFLLESMEGPRRSARLSIMGFSPVVRFVARGEQVSINDVVESVLDPFERLRALYYQLDRPMSTSLPFSGGMVGYISYDMVRFFEELPCRTVDDLQLPEAYFIVPSIVVCFDHETSTVYSISRESGLEQFIDGSVQIGDVTIIDGCVPSTTRAEYEDSVERAKEYILNGDIFQVVLSRRNAYSFSGDRMRMYQVLREINPSPYMFLLDFSGLCLIGSSPEMLIQLRGDTLLSKPIAGTRPRSDNVEEDERLKVEMLLDPKERAEHVMLVDLHRNDIGRVAEYGSVVVDQFMEVEKFSHVQHIVSRVRGRLRRGLDLFDALRASFPAGTVSGAPKIRAMEIIDELEPVRRGPYAGIVGYIDLHGNMDFAITIRSLMIKGSTVYVQAGAGVVADSVPSREFLETEHKMQAMIEALRRCKS